MTTIEQYLERTGRKDTLDNYRAAVSELRAAGYVLVAVGVENYWLKP